MKCVITLIEIRETLLIFKIRKSILLWEDKGKMPFGYKFYVDVYESTKYLI